MSCFPGDRREMPGSTRQLERQSCVPGRSKTIKLPRVSQAPQLSDVNNSSRRLQARSRQLIIFIKFMFFFFYFFFFPPPLKYQGPGATRWPSSNSGPFEHREMCAGGWSRDMLSPCEPKNKQQSPPRGQIVDMFMMMKWGRALKGGCLEMKK